MILILCHPDDAAAVWLDAAWRAAGVTRVELVSVEQLVFSRGIVHRLDGTGDSGAIRLADGRVLRPERITGIVNRVKYLPTQHFAMAGATDRAYASAELAAFLLAWLNGTAGRVVNPALPGALGGGDVRASAVTHLAAMAGLPTVAWRGSTVPTVQQVTTAPPATDTAVVFDGRVFGRVLPLGLQDGCRRLAALLGVPLLQAFLHRSREHGWRFVDAVPSVDFRAGGRPLASAIAGALGEQARP